MVQEFLKEDIVNFSHYLLLNITQINPNYEFVQYNQLEVDDP